MPMMEIHHVLQIYTVCDQYVGRGGQHRQQVEREEKRRTSNELSDSFSNGGNSH